MRSILFVGVVAGMAAFAVALGGCGGGAGDSGTFITAHLYQTTPGQQPVIRMGWNLSGGADPSLVVAWLIYRGSSAGLGAEPTSLIDVREDRELGTYDDQPTAGGATSLSIPFNYVQYGTSASGTITATFSRPALVVGQTYYYSARVVVAPNTPKPPLVTGGAVRPRQASTLTVTPPEALSDAGASQGPVTYFVPPAVLGPGNGSSSADPRHISFTWNTTTGADQYQVRIYTDPSASGTPAVISPVLTPASSFGSWNFDARAGTGITPLSGSTTYYWVVGARALGQAEPVCGTDGGWLKSEIRQFTTVTLPPGP